MSAATQAKSARARAGIAARLFKTVKPWPNGFGLGRNFDDCFEMNDGAEVKRILFEKMRQDPDLVSAMVAHGETGWVSEAMGDRVSGLTMDQVQP